MRLRSAPWIGLGGLLVAACSSSSSPAPTTLEAGADAARTDGGAPAGDGGGCAAQVDPGNQACTSCVVQRCSSELSSCAASCDCISLVNCVFACDTGSASASSQCARACAGTRDAGQDLGSALDDCVAQNCLATDDAGAVSGPCAR